MGKWGRFLGKVSGVASAAFGAWDAIDGATRAYHAWKSGDKAQAISQGLRSAAGVLSVVGGVALLTGAGAPVAGVALGAAAVLSGIGAAVEIVGDKQKRDRALQALKAVGRSAQTMAQKVYHKVAQGFQGLTKGFTSLFSKG